MNRLALLLVWVMIMGLSVVVAIWMLASILSGSPRALNIALAYDRLGNAALGNSGHETISSRLGRTGNPAWAERVVDWLFLQLTGERNHCKNNIDTQFRGGCTST